VVLLSISNRGLTPDLNSLKWKVSQEALAGAKKQHGQSSSRKCMVIVAVTFVAAILLVILLHFL
jgi:hypothetical protein